MRQMLQEVAAAANTQLASTLLNSTGGHFGSSRADSAAASELTQSVRLRFDARESCRSRRRCCLIFSLTKPAKPRAKRQSSS